MDHIYREEARKLDLIMAHLFSKDTMVKSYRFSWARALPLVLIGLTIALDYFRKEKHLSVTAESVPDAYTNSYFFTHFYRVFGEVHLELLLLWSLLFLLPTTILHRWLLYIGSWAVPLSVYLVLSTEVSRGGFFQTTPATTASNLVLLLTISVVVLLVGHVLLWFRRRREASSN